MTTPQQAVTSQHTASVAVLPLPTVPTPRPATQGSLALDLQEILDPTPLPARIHSLDEGAHRDGERWARRFVHAAVEIATGNRPATQLVRWSTEEVYADLTRRGVLVARAAGRCGPEASSGLPRPRLMSVRCSSPRRGVLESWGHVRYGERSRAVAARFELRRGNWICTALEFA